MKLGKLRHEPSELLEFFREGLETLGAACDRTWFDRLHVLAEGRAARLWNEEGNWVEREIRFPAPDLAGPRQAEHEVFPGCPLTFRLAEALNGGALTLQRAVLRTGDKHGAPSAEVAERVWRLQFPGTTHWRMMSGFTAHPHLSLVALVRCEIQAIDQHWSLHRLAISLPDGEADPGLTDQLELQAIAADTSGTVDWPVPELAGWHSLLLRALEQDLASDLSGIRQRQESYLRRELDRVDGYFENYRRELAARAGRAGRRTGAEAQARYQQRLAATEAEHERRRLDQVHRHAIRVLPHVDALVLLAEPAWRVTLNVSRHDDGHRQEALWVPRMRRWSRA